MKILVPGKKANMKIWFGECSKCGAIVSANIKELTNILRHDLIDCKQSWETCPFCKEKASVCFVPEDSEKGQSIDKKVHAVESLTPVPVDDLSNFNDDVVLVASDNEAEYFGVLVPDIGLLIPSFQIFLHHDRLGRFHYLEQRLYDHVL